MHFSPSFFRPVIVASRAIGVGRSRAALAFACILTLCGCVANQPLDITHEGGESILPETLRLANVRVGAKLANAEDTIERLERTVQTGKVYRQVFTGSDDAPAVIELVNSSCTAEIGSPYAGASGEIEDPRATYSATVALTFKGETHILKTTKAVSSYKSIERAVRKAVERGVLDLTRQAQAHLPRT